MTIRSSLHPLIAPALRRFPVLRRSVRKLDVAVERALYSAAVHVPAVIRPEPRQIAVAITAQCNLSCTGCRYGRDFMNGSQLSLPMISDLIDDAAEAGLKEVRLYGGEPLLHPDLPHMVQRVVERGMRPYVTTNAILLGHRIDALYSAGLRWLNIGYYGSGAKYDSYVHRKRMYERLEAGVAAARDRYGMELNMRINWLLMRPSCNLEDMNQACRFAEKYRLRIQLDLVHYSLPYFTEGPEGELQFREQDRPEIERVVADMTARARANPELFTITPGVMSAVPDWLLKGPAMRVPCDANRLLWVGADGTVQLCYVTFRLGNLHEQRLKTMLFGAAHRQAARDAWALNCPNCHCGFDTRTRKHIPTWRQYRHAEQAAID